jgi:hypothetical protein
MRPQLCSHRRLQGSLLRLKMMLAGSQKPSTATATAGGRQTTGSGMAMQMTGVTGTGTKIVTEAATGRATGVLTKSGQMYARQSCRPVVQN